jgi:hypothetical protein
MTIESVKAAKQMLNKYDDLNNRLAEQHRGTDNFVHCLCEGSIIASKIAKATLNESGIEEVMAMWDAHVAKYSA